VDEVADVTPFTTAMIAVIFHTYGSLLIPWTEVAQKSTIRLLPTNNHWLPLAVNRDPSGLDILHRFMPISSQLAVSC
jgi:hypothetical protein